MATETSLDVLEGASWHQPRALSARRTPLSCQVLLIAALLLVSWFIAEDSMFLGEL